MKKLKMSQEEVSDSPPWTEAAAAAPSNSTTTTTTSTNTNSTTPQFLPIDKLKRPQSANENFIKSQLGRAPRAKRSGFNRTCVKGLNLNGRSYLLKIGNRNIKVSTSIYDGNNRVTIKEYDAEDRVIRGISLSLDNYFALHSRQDRINSAITTLKNTPVPDGEESVADWVCLLGGRFLTLEKMAGDKNICIRLSTWYVDREDRQRENREYAIDLEEVELVHLLNAHSEIVRMAPYDLMDFVPCFEKMDHNNETCRTCNPFRR